jgi:hypothetical protein
MSEGQSSWYNTGYDGVDREKERIARNQGPNRFWMKEGTKKEIVFIDDEPFSIYEHNPKINGTWRNQFTCLRDVTDMAVCCEKLGERDRSFVGFYTVVDISPIADEKNKKYQYEVKLFPAKLKTLSLLRRKKQDRGSLIGCMFNVFRDGREDPNCGSEFEFQREADLTKLFDVATYRGRKLTELYKEATEKPETLARLKEVFQLEVGANGVIAPKINPFGYLHLLKPRDPKDIRLLLGAATIESGGGGDGGGEGGAQKDDEIPF